MKLKNIAKGLVVIGALGAIAGCSSITGKERLLFDGVEMRYKAKHVDKDDRMAFAVEAWPVSETLEGARQAAIYAGTEYCIGNFGTSAIKWGMPTDIEALPPFVDGDRLHLSGECRP